MTLTIPHRQHWEGRGGRTQGYERNGNTARRGIQGRRPQRLPDAAGAREVAATRHACPTPPARHRGRHYASSKPKTHVSRPRELKAELKSNRSTQCDARTQPAPRPHAPNARQSHPQSPYSVDRRGSPPMPGHAQVSVTRLRPINKRHDVVVDLPFRPTALATERVRHRGVIHIHTKRGRRTKMSRARVCPTCKELHNTVRRTPMRGTASSKRKREQRGALQHRTRQLARLGQSWRR